MNSRDLRLLGLAAAGLSLVLVARGSEGADHDAFTIEDPSVKDAEPGVISGGSAAAPDAIRLLDFGEIDQPGLTCGDVLDSTPGTIRVSQGESATLDQDRFVRLEVDGDIVYGDVDKDGFDEAVVHTTCEYGANGVQDTIQVWDLDTGSAEVKATLTEPPAAIDGVLMPTVKDVAIDDGQLAVTWTQYDADDPRCCPSLESTVHFLVAGNEITPVGSPQTSAATT